MSEDGDVVDRKLGIKPFEANHEMFPLRESGRIPMLCAQQESSSGYEGILGSRSSFFGMHKNKDAWNGLSKKGPSSFKTACALSDNYFRNFGFVFIIICFPFFLLCIFFTVGGVCDRGSWKHHIVVSAPIGWKWFCVRMLRCKNREWRTVTALECLRVFFFVLLIICVLCIVLTQAWLVGRRVGGGMLTFVFTCKRDVCYRLT